MAFYFPLAILHLIQTSMGREVLPRGGRRSDANPAAPSLGYKAAQWGKEKTRFVMFGWKEEACSSFCSDFFPPGFMPFVFLSSFKLLGLLWGKASNFSGWICVNVEVHSFKHPCKSQSAQASRAEADGVTECSRAPHALVLLFPTPSSVHCHLLHLAPGLGLLHPL